MWLLSEAPRKIVDNGATLTFSDVKCVKNGYRLEGLIGEREQRSVEKEEKNQQQQQQKKPTMEELFWC